MLTRLKAAGSPTALVARREMEAWRMLRLEPAALRRPDTFSAPVHLATDGSHLPATLYRLACQAREGDETLARDETVAAGTQGRIEARLAGLVDGLHEITVDRDEKRELLTLYARDDGGISHPAWALSDGTLRLLALAILATDPETQGLLCLEEPENGIHPARIPAMLELLHHTAADTRLSVGPDNTLRQVIVNTHSPAVLRQVPRDSVLFVSTGGASDATARGAGGARFSCLKDTWRTRADNPPSVVSCDDLRDYLAPAFTEDRPTEAPGEDRRRSVDGEDAAQLPLLSVC